MSFLVNDVAAIRAEFEQSGENVDPESITVSVTSPSAVVTTYVYGVSVAVERESLGHYLVNIQLTEVGEWTYVWSSVTPTTTISGLIEVVDSVDAVVLQARDSGPAAVPGVLFNVLSLSGDLVSCVTTGPGGNGTVNLADGVYRVIGAKQGWRFPITTITVAGAGSVMITGVHLSIEAATVSIQLCRLYGYIVDMSGQAPVDGVEVIVEPAGKGELSFADTSAIGLDRSNVGVYKSRKMIRPSSVNGFWEIELVQGMKYQVSVPSLGFVRVFRCPSSSTLNIRDVRSAPGKATVGQTGDFR